MQTNIPIWIETRLKSNEETAQLTLWVKQATIDYEMLTKLIFNYRSENCILTTKHFYYQPVLPQSIHVLKLVQQEKTCVCLNCVSCKTKLWKALNNIRSEICCWSALQLSTDVCNLSPLTVFAWVSPYKTTQPNIINEKWRTETCVG